MTPKEKAEELILKFAPYSEDNVNIYISKMILAKSCALIAVDEIIKSGPSFPYDIQFDSMPHFRSLKYWQEVKQEIEKL